jgi:uncharacterized protein YjbJ (UPF0337 family)
MNQQIVKGKWNEFKGEMRKVWGDLTDDELEKTKGSVQAIGGVLQQKYGRLEGKASENFNSLIDRFSRLSAEGEEKTGEIKDTARDKH